MKNSITIFISALLAIASNCASATVLAYEGFATDISGSGNNYVNGNILATNGTAPNFDGVDKTRIGYTGGWGPVGANNLSASINSTAVIGGLSYSGFATGDPGTANPFRSSGVAGAQKWVARELSIANDGSYDTGYFVAALVDFNSSSGGGFGWSLVGNRDNYVEYNGTTATLTTGGSAGQIFSFTPSSGTNLIVIQYTDETTGGFNPAYYTRWNLWVNPDLSGGDLGTVTATGFGIGLFNGSGIGDFSYGFVSASKLTAGQNIFVDEMYITNDATDFISVPEPQTYALIMCLVSLGAVMLRRRRRA